MRWQEYPKLSESPFSDESIDGMDYGHPVHVLEVNGMKDAALLFHNECALMGEDYYWGANFWVRRSYDGACGDDLEKLKLFVENQVDVK